MVKLRGIDGSEMQNFCICKPCEIIQAHKITSTQLNRPIDVYAEADQCFRCAPKGCIVWNKKAHKTNQHDHTNHALVAALQYNSLARDTRVKLTSR